MNRQFVVADPDGCLLRIDTERGADAADAARGTDESQRRSSSARRAERGGHVTKVIADITMSLDGFVTGPNAGPGAGLGDGGMPLHDWVFNGDDVDQAVLATTMERSGAVVMGRNVFDVVDAPDGWSSDIGYGAHHVGRPPFFVVTHQRPTEVRLALDITFVSAGVAAAVAAARSACPTHQDVVIMGGGTVIAQAVELDLVDELLLHISPVLLGAGTPLWSGAAARRFRQTDVQVSPFATHITYAPQR